MDNDAKAPVTAAKHLAIFARSLSGGGGAERVVLQLAGAMAERGHRIDLILARTKGRYLDELPPTVRLVELHAPPAILAVPGLMREPRTLAALLPAMIRPGVAQVLGAIPALRRYLLNERPDAILAALDYANFAAIIARRLAGVPVRTIASVHNHMSSAAANAQRPHLRHVVPLARRLYPDADTVVCVSDGVASDLVASAGVPPALLTTIYNPVITPRIAELADAPIPHRWLQQDEVPVILGVGKLRRQKDFATLIRAFAKVRKICPAHLIILGEGPERNKLKRLAHELGVADDVDLHGFDPNPYAFMSRASVFVLSSAWEGFGNVLVEAMACGCPVVSTDCPSGPGEILEHGRYGRLVPVGAADALAEAILSQLEAPSDGRAAARRAAEFTAAASAARYEGVLFPR